MKVVLCVLVTVLAELCRADLLFITRGVATHVKRQSGKINFYPFNMTDADGVSITFDAMKEVGGGAEITAHTYRNFAQLNFATSDTEDAIYPGSSVDVTKFSCMTDIPLDSVNAKLTTEIYIFKENGSITVDGKHFEVKAGQMKFDVMVQNWTFCNTCTNNGQAVTGEYLDVDIYVKARQTPKKTNKDGTYELGGGTVMTFPKSVSMKI